LRTCHALYPAPNALELLPLLVQILSCSYGDAVNGELDQSINHVTSHDEASFDFSTSNMSVSLFKEGKAI
jgi:hypothetical protein